MRYRGITSFGLVAASLLVPVTAFFRMGCPGSIVRERADPIVSPGKASGHVHTISGGSGFGFEMSYEDAINSACTSCSIKEDLSNYWVPSLYFHAKNGSFINVPQSGDGTGHEAGILIYYLQRGGPDNDKLHAFPKGFRMLAGDPSKRSFGNDLASKAVTYACLGAEKPETNNFPPYKCGQMRTQIFFPSCWDGVNLDSPDHKSHMSYPASNDYNNGRCPPTHPVHMVSLFYEVYYDTGVFDGLWDGDKQPFVLSNGDATGYGFHGDFVNGWDVDVLQRAIDTCNSVSGELRDCNAFTLQSNDDANNCKLPRMIDEEIEGVLDALPGCNPVSNGPGVVKPVANCPQPEIGFAESFFTDITVTKQWMYAGCGTDDNGDRTLQGADTRKPDMTVEKCIDFCSGKGFRIAGLEYGNECYCGNSVAEDRKPKAGVLGNCQMKCLGDDGEICGGARALSIYEQCNAGNCQNVEFSGAMNTTTATSSDSQTIGQSKKRMADLSVHKHGVHGSRF
ncbi:WSC domain-containing protein [Patellaria atrata CBS 101060]|uniref:WSC domain-containing protein n=1 Tax=Patellaria atrata CBS 101060 TaxID=1346257 RepID=A0A9P4VN87_9PEZI|nr:WSC domain-containing protein [Patellaria atrata CBS 101060]